MKLIDLHKATSHLTGFTAYQTSPLVGRHWACGFMFNRQYRCIERYMVAVRDGPRCSSHELEGFNELDRS